MSLRCSFSCLTAMTLQMLCVAHGTFGPRAEEDHFGPLPEGVVRHLNTSALNSRLAFEPYRVLASSEPEAARPSNILFSPLGLASALALLSGVSDPRSRSQALEPLGLGADSTEQSVENATSALSHLLHNLTLPEGRGVGGVQEADSEAGAGTTTAGGGGGSDADAAESRTRGGSRLKVWSGLQADGKQSDYQSFLSSNQHDGSSDVDTLQRDLGSSDKVEFNNFVYFKGTLVLIGEGCSL